MEIKIEGVLRAAVRFAVWAYAPVSVNYDASAGVWVLEACMFVRRVA